MIERRERLRFTREPGQAIGIAGERLGQDFHGDVAIERRIARAIDLAHTAGADRGEDFVRTEARAGAQAHRFVTGAMRRSSLKSPQRSRGVLITCAGWRAAL